MIQSSFFSEKFLFELLLDIKNMVVLLFIIQIFDTLQAQSQCYGSTHVLSPRLNILCILLFFLKESIVFPVYFEQAR